MEQALNIAYVIAAHKNPKQFSRLIHALSGAHADFFVHIDKKVPIQIFKDAIGFLPDSNVHFLKQYNATWSEYGIIKAEINALKTIVNASKHYDFIILLSGQDYPIKSNEYLINFFKKNIHKCFIDYFPMPFAPWPNGGMDRVNRYHFKIFGKSFAYPPYKKPKGKLSHLVHWLFGKYFGQRVLPLGMKPFGGEHWWNFNHFTAQYLIKYLQEHPEYYKFHKYSFCADEMFFQTILVNSTNNEVKNNLINDDLRYYDWSEGKDSPKTFTMADLDILRKSDKLFARKFDSDIDEEILNEIDKIIGI